MPIKHPVVNHPWSIPQADRLLFLAISVTCVSYGPKLDTMDDTVLSKVRDCLSTIKPKLCSRKRILSSIVNRTAIRNVEKLISKLYSQFPPSKKQESRKPVTDRGLIPAECDVQDFDLGSPRTDTLILAGDASSIPLQVAGSPISVSDYDEAMRDDEPFDASNQPFVDRMMVAERINKDQQMQLPDNIGDTVEAETGDEDDRNDLSQPRSAPNGHSGDVLSRDQISAGSAPSPSRCSTSNPSEYIDAMDIDVGISPEPLSSLEVPLSSTSYLDALCWDKLNLQIEAFEAVAKVQTYSFISRVVNSDWLSVCRNDYALDRQGELVGIHSRIQKVFVYRQFEAAIKDRSNFCLTFQANPSREAGPVSVAKVELFKKMREAAAIDGEGRRKVNHPEMLSSMSNAQSNDEYRNERRRISTAERWNDVQRNFGWAGVVFHSWMPWRWFDVRDISDKKWLIIKGQLQSVQDKFNSVVQSKIPEMAEVLLSKTISGCFIPFDR